MLTAMVVLLFIGVFLVDFVPMAQMPLKEKILYFAFTAVGIGVLMLYSLDIPVPSPAEGIQSLIKSLFSM